MKSLRTILVCLLTMLLAAGNAGAVSFTTTVTATVTSTSAISVSPATIAFGSVGATTVPPCYRYRTPVANVTYFPAGGAWEIRVYTDNGVGPVVARDDPLVRGFIRDAATAAANRLYLKIWGPNHSANRHISATAGPTLATTTSYTDYVWKGYSLDGDATLDELLTSGTYNEVTIKQDINGDGDILDSFTAGAGADAIYEGASFSLIREADTFVGTHEADTLTEAQDWRCALAWNSARGDATLGSPFPVVFATDLMGLPAATYTSANNTVAITTGQTAVAGVFFDLKIY